MTPYQQPPTQPRQSAYPQPGSNSPQRGSGGLPPNKGKKWLYIVLAVVIAGLVAGAFVAGRLTGGGSEAPTETPTAESLLGEVIGQLINDIPEAPTKTLAEAPASANDSQFSKVNVEPLLEDYEANTQKLKTLFGRLDCVDQETFREDVVPLTERHKLLAYEIRNRISDRGNNADEVERAEAAYEEFANVLKSMPELCPDHGQSPTVQQQEPEWGPGFPVYESIFD